MNKEVTSKSYTLYTEQGGWLRQVVLTDDGMFSAVTDYGNMSFAWRSYGEQDFRKFLIGLNVDYFGTKMYQGMAYMINGTKYEKACQRFAEKILSALQNVLIEEIEAENLKNINRASNPKFSHNFSDLIIHVKKLIEKEEKHLEWLYQQIINEEVEEMIVSSNNHLENYKKRLIEYTEFEKTIVSH